MKIVIHLDTDNEAFGNGRYEELVELILQEIATKVANGEDIGRLTDRTNKTVCEFTVWSS